MEILTDLVRSLSGGNDTQQWLFLLTAGATAFLFALGISFLVLAATDPVRRRLSRMAGTTGAGGRLADRIVELLAPINNALLPKAAGERGQVEKRLSFAGFRSANALPMYYAIKTGLALAFLLAVLFGSFWLPQLATTKLLFYAMLAAFIGLMLPNYMLEYLVGQRQKRLRDAFPDALDMLVVCVEAGLGLTAAIQRVAEELRLSHPELGAEFNLVSAEMRAGVEREAALKGLGVRTGLDDIRGLVSLLVQTLKFGTSVGETLRVYAEEFRDKRMQRAEELGAKIGTKLIFPLVLFMFPAFFVVAIGPAILRIMSVFTTLGDQTGP